MLTDKQFRIGGATRPTRPKNAPADVMGSAVRVMRIATGQETDDTDSVKSAAAELGGWGGKAQGANMTPGQRE